MQRGSSPPPDPPISPIEPIILPRQERLISSSPLSLSSSSSRGTFFLIGSCSLMCHTDPVLYYDHVRPQGAESFEAAEGGQLFGHACFSHRIAASPPPSPCNTSFLQLKLDVFLHWTNCVFFSSPSFPIRLQKVKSQFLMLNLYMARGYIAR